MTAPPEKQKFPRADALAVARELCAVLKPICARLIVAGSLRRGKPAVGDVEILYIPYMAPITKLRQTDLLVPPPAELLNTTDPFIDDLVTRGILTQRRNIGGSITWGQKNKLATHHASGIPVDFFATTDPCWFNYLVCRTGSADTNIRIANAYQDEGCKWNPYGPGYTNKNGIVCVNATERSVFLNAGLSYLEPRDR